jgi:hypothetical protein
MNAHIRRYMHIRTCTHIKQFALKLIASKTIKGPAETVQSSKEMFGTRANFLRKTSQKSRERERERERERLKPDRPWVGCLEVFFENNLFFLRKFVFDLFSKQICFRALNSECNLLLKHKSHSTPAILYTRYAYAPQQCLHDHRRTHIHVFTQTHIHKRHTTNIHTHNNSPQTYTRTCIQARLNIYVHINAHDKKHTQHSCRHMRT